MGKKLTKEQKIAAAKVSDYELSLTKILGEGIKDITGYISYEFGDRTFKLCRLILKDGTDLAFEGEHDHPYLTEGYGENAAAFDDDLLEQYEEE